MPLTLTGVCATPGAVNGGTRTASFARMIARLLVAALLAAAVQPCPTALSPVADPAGSSRSHAAHAEVAAPGEPSELTAHEHCGPSAQSLRAPCTCGCADTPGADANPSRLPLALLAAGSSSATPLAPLASEGPGDTLPESPRQPTEHVPLRPSA